MGTESARLLRATASAIVDLEARPALLVDARRRVHAANEAFRRMLGNRGDAVGLACHELNHSRRRPCHAAFTECPLARARATGAPARAVHVHVTARGPCPMLVRVRPAGGPARRGRFLLVMEPLREVGARPTPGKPVGRSPAFCRVLAAITRLAPTRTPVLLHGPAGAGKWRLARLIHAMSPRRTGPFVSLDCRGLTHREGAAELFGVRAEGSSSRVGAVTRADHGSLYLRAVEALPRSLHGPLLRLGEQGVYLPEGADRLLTADVRLLAGARDGVAGLRGAARLEPGLASLLGIFPVEVPPLSRRREDIPLLAESILQEIEGDGPARRLDAASAAALRRHEFRGNIRELAEILSRGRAASRGRVVTLVELLRQAPSSATTPPPDD